MTGPGRELQQLFSSRFSRNSELDMAVTRKFPKRLYRASTEDIEFVLSDSMSWWKKPLDLGVNAAAMTSDHGENFRVT